MVRFPARRLRAIAVTIASIAILLGPSCGRELKFDDKKIARKCKVALGPTLTREQAVCIARLAGLHDGKRCPFDVTELATDQPDDAAFRVRETCGSLGLLLADDGRVAAVEVGDAVAR